MGCSLVCNRRKKLEELRPTNRKSPGKNAQRPHRVLRDSRNDRFSQNSKVKTRQNHNNNKKKETKRGNGNENKTKRQPTESFYK